MQFWAWMGVVAFALLALLVAWVLDQAGATNAPVGEAFDAFTEEGLDETYLLLLGLRAAAAIGAKAITMTKIENGTVDKTDKPENETSSPVKELVSDDNGNGDLGDAQYVLFNLVALAYFLAQFLLYPDKGLPVMPDTLGAAKRRGRGPRCVAMLAVLSTMLPRSLAARSALQAPRPPLRVARADHQRADPHPSERDRRGPDHHALGRRRLAPHRWA